jgi:hypothetical protein
MASSSSPCARAREVAKRGGDGDVPVGQEEIANQRLGARPQPIRCGRALRSWRSVFFLEVFSFFFSLRKCKRKAGKKIYKES